jgi:nucleoside-diphosphate-sugar epimerase
MSHGDPSVEVNVRGRSKTLGVFFSSGDLGEVGMHVVAAALERASDEVNEIRVFSNHITSLDDRKWNCGCRTRHAFTERDRQRLKLICLDCTKDPLAIHLEGVDAVVSCLGNRKPFHPDCIAKAGTGRIVQAMMATDVRRLALLSSVGIAEDWPPMEWSREGGRLSGFFRTVCWTQYQDLSGAEQAVRLAEQLHADLDSLVVRTVLLGEHSPPSGKWFVQHQKHGDHPDHHLAKMDCARFLVQEAVHGTLSRRAVVVGGVPKQRHEAREKENNA